MLWTADLLTPLGCMPTPVAGATLVGWRSGLCAILEFYRQRVDEVFLDAFRCLVAVLDRIEPLEEAPGLPVTHTEDQVEQESTCSTIARPQSGVSRFTIGSNEHLDGQSEGSIRVFR